MEHSSRIRTSCTVVAAAMVVTFALSGCDSFTPVGEVKNPSVAINRDGAASATVGGNVVWVFGDTFTASGGVRNSAALANPSAPENVTDVLHNGVPAAAVPFTSAETQTNTQSSDGGRWVIWPASILPTGTDDAVILSSKFYAKPDGWVDSSLVVSRIHAGDTQSMRVDEPLSSPDSNFASGPYLYKGNIYLMDCGGLNIPPQAAQRVMPGLPSTADLLGWNGTGKCRLARVPLDQVTDHSAYQFWTGKLWGPSSLLATPVVPGSNAGLTVAYDPYFGKFIALSVPGLSNEVQLSTAPAPEGPWTKPQTIYKTPNNIYALRIHPNLSPTDLSTLTITYFRQDQPGQPGGIVLGHLKLDKR